jgi:hypothetical protein
LLVLFELNPSPLRGTPLEIKGRLSLDETEVEWFISSASPLSRIKYGIWGVPRRGEWFNASGLMRKFNAGRKSVVSCLTHSTGM